MDLRSAFAAALVAACSFAPAYGDQADRCKTKDIQRFEFTGKVLQSLPMAPQGAKVTGTFSFDLSVEPGILNGERDGRGYGFASYQYPLSFSLKVNGHTIVAETTFVDVSNNSGSNIEDAININGGYPLVIDGTTFPEGLIGLALASGPGRKQVLKSTDLPSKINVKQFDGWAYGVVQQSGGPNDTLVSFSIDKVEPVKPR